MLCIVPAWQQVMLARMANVFATSWASTAGTRRKALAGNCVDSHHHRCDDLRSHISTSEVQVRRRNSGIIDHGDDHCRRQIGRSSRSAFLCRCQRAKFLAFRAHGRGLPNLDLLALDRWVVRLGHRRKRWLLKKTNLVNLQCHMASWTIASIAKSCNPEPIEKSADETFL